MDGLLQAALERDPAERAAFLKRASGGDDALRKEVESLLASDEGDSFLKSLALEHAAPLLDDTKSNSILGRRIGSYQIISQPGVLKDCCEFRIQSQGPLYLFSGN